MSPADQLAALTAHVAANPSTLPFDGANDYPEPDMYVSPNEAEHRQRGYDDWLMRGAS